MGIFVVSFSCYFCLFGVCVCTFRVFVLFLYALHCLFVYSCVFLPLFTLCSNLVILNLCHHITHCICTNCFNFCYLFTLNTLYDVFLLPLGLISLRSLCSFILICFSFVLFIPLYIVQLSLIMYNTIVYLFLLIGIHYLVVYIDTIWACIVYLFAGLYFLYTDTKFTVWFTKEEYLICVGYTSLCIVFFIPWFHLNEISL